uniref:Uncharacterized protein n=1 Tax=Trypanosoma congolense (strain IL3000) TaxID=1068625 RepID=G0UXB7_TRYCI|nr:conserved hypothetical protein [Trypanosoma congolense IL3000]
MENESDKKVEAAVERFLDTGVAMEKDVEPNDSCLQSPTCVAPKDGGDHTRPRISLRGLRGTIRSPYYSPTRSSVMSPLGAGSKGDIEKDYAGGAGEAETVPDIDVIPRYRSRPNRSQGSFSHVNRGMYSPTHSRMSSYEHFSWDSQAWKDVIPETAFLDDQSRDLFRLRHHSIDSFCGSPIHQSGKHVRSFATWDKAEEDGAVDNYITRSSSPLHHASYELPASTLDALPEPVYETAPLGHQHCFSLSSPKEAIQQGASWCAESGVAGAETTREVRSQVRQGPAMTHVLVAFKNLYGCYYVPEALRGTLVIGDLVSVESHSGENTGKVIYDLSSIFGEQSRMWGELVKHPRSVLWPETASLPLEKNDPLTNEELLTRLPCVLRRGMNKGKKRLYYARRRENEALEVSNRLIRERNLNLTITSVEYQVDFKRITVLCAGERTCAEPSELLAFSQQLTSNLRGTVVNIVFANELPDRLDVTRSITKGVLHNIYSAAITHSKEAEASQAQGQGVAAPAGAPATFSKIQNTVRAPHMYADTPVTPVAPVTHAPLMPFYAVPPSLPPPFPAPITPGAPPLMTAVSVNGLYRMTGMPTVGWGMPTPPPYIPPRTSPSMTGRT